MNIIINCVHPEGLTPDEQVFIQLLRTDIKLLESLMSKSLLIVNKEHLVSNGYILAWKDSLSEIILSNKKVPKSQNITDWIDNYRNVFKNKKAGAMGSKKSCVEKMLLARKILTL